MRFYNQKNARIEWDEAKPPIVWEPFGVAEVPDHLVEHLRLQRLPVDISQIPPESKAKIVFDAGAESARKDDILALKRELEESCNLVKSLKGDLESERREHSLTKAKLEKSDADMSELAVKSASLDADKKAAEQLIEEMGRKLGEIEVKKPGQAPKLAEQKK